MGEGTPNAAPSDHTPDFTFPNHDVIHESNWPEYQAKGFQPVPEPLKWAQSLYGTEHVYTGDAYDYNEGRPLRHKPGMYVYVDPEGLAIGQEKARLWREERRREGSVEGPDQSAGGPEAS